LLPLLRRRYQPAIDRLVRRQIDLLSAESEWLAQGAHGWLEQSADPPFAQLHRSLQRRVVETQLTAAGVHPDYELIERLRAEPGRPVTVGPGRRIRLGADGRLHPDAGPAVLEFSNDFLVVDLARSRGSAQFGGREIRWWRTRRRLSDAAIRRQARPGQERFDSDQVGGRIVVRHWRAGDRFQPCGMSRPVKVQDLFTNLRVSREDRHRRLVAVTASGVVFWVEGLRIGEHFRLTSSSRTQLRWCWTVLEGVKPGGEPPRGGEVHELRGAREGASLPRNR
jgi:tRNA(Ile)-lysidine synthase